MKVKKYVAGSMPEAMNQIRKELGKEAVILNSKEIQQGGFFGFFKKKNIEVVAALDPQPLPVKKKHAQHTPMLQKQSSNQKVDNEQVLYEINMLKKMIAAQSGQEKLDPAYQSSFQHLLDHEVEQQLALELVNTVIAMNGNVIATQNNNLTSDRLRAEIAEKLTAIESHGLHYRKKIMQFIGPTGVGKTTTIAKVAAKMILEDKKKVAFITADTYRIGAVEQLRTYARILNIPLEVVYTMEDYQHAVARFDSYDVVLVDTAGRNFRDQKYLEEHRELIDMETAHTFLVLSLTAKPKDITEIYDQFEHFPVDQIIFTKLDETRQYGSILNITLGKRVGIACMSNGQDVPEDLIMVNPDRISELLVGEYGEA